MSPPLIAWIVQKKKEKEKEIKKRNKIYVVYNHRGGQRNTYLHSRHRCDIKDPAQVLPGRKTLVVDAVQLVDHWQFGTPSAYVRLRDESNSRIRPVPGLRLKPYRVKKASMFP